MNFEGTDNEESLKYALIKALCQVTYSLNGGEASVKKQY